MIKRLLDSSCWIEIFTEGKNHRLCEKYRNESDEVLVPSLVVYEVYKKIRSNFSEDQALSAISFMSQNQILNLDRDTALLAADLSIEHNLAMADSFVLAHAHFRNAELITRDFDFANIPGVVIVN